MDSIRNATLEDIPHLVELGRRFIAAAGQDYRADVATATLEQLVSNETAVLLVNENLTAMLGGVLYPYFFNGERVAQELFWWAEGSGLKLLEAFEQWAKDNDARAVLMVCLEALSPERVSRIYERRGYVPLERTFMKELTT